MLGPNLLAAPIRFKPPPTSANKDRGALFKARRAGGGPPHRRARTILPRQQRHFGQSRRGHGLAAASDVVFQHAPLQRLLHQLVLHRLVLHRLVLHRLVLHRLVLHRLVLHRLVHRLLLHRLLMLLLLHMRIVMRQWRRLKLHVLSVLNRHLLHLAIWTHLDRVRWHCRRRHHLRLGHQRLSHLARLLRGRLEVLRMQHAAVGHHVAVRQHPARVCPGDAAHSDKVLRADTAEIVRRLLAHAGGSVRIWRIQREGWRRPCSLARRRLTQDRDVEYHEDAPGPDLRRKRRSQRSQPRRRGRSSARPSAREGRRWTLQPEMSSWHASGMPFLRSSRTIGDSVRDGSCARAGASRPSRAARGARTTP